VIFGRSPNEAWASYVDLFDSFVKGNAGFRYSCFEWVEVDDYQIKLSDGMIGEGLKVRGVISSGEDTAEYFRVKGFNPSIHNFWESGVLSDFDGWDTCIEQEFSGSTGAVDFYPAICKAFGKIK